MPDTIPAVEPLRAHLEVGRGSAAGIGFVELVDVHWAAHYRRAGQSPSPREALTANVALVGGIGGAVQGHPPGMATATSKHRVALIDQMAAEWHSLGRSRGRPALRRWPAATGAGTASRSGRRPPPCPTPST